MKKLIFLLAITLIFSGCTKTEVDIDLENANKNADQLTREESEIFDKEDSEFQEDYAEALAEASEEQRLNESVELVYELEDSEDDKIAGRKIKGSCNAIAESSTCLEYYGYFWNETQMRLNCEGSGTFSSSPCPVDMAGGCNTGMGTSADMVAWMYLRGNGGMTAESMKYAKMACDATMASKWLVR